MSAFFDAMVIGEGEEVIFEIIDAYEAWRAEYPRPTTSDASDHGSDRIRLLARPGARRPVGTTGQNPRRLCATLLRRSLLR